MLPRRAAVSLLLSLPLALSAAACKHDTPAAPTPSVPAEVNAGPDGRVMVSVGAEGYTPATVHAPAGRPLTLVFTRTSDEGCGQQVVFPSLNIRRDLPLNQPVEVLVNPTVGSLAFTCGMNMLHGSVVAQ